MAKSLFIRLLNHPAAKRLAALRPSLDCSLLGHRWIWQEKVPASIDGESRFDGNHELIPDYFEAPFRRGFAWACSRTGCKQWSSVSQLMSSEKIPKAHQKRTLYGHYADFKPGYDPSYILSHRS